jgi:protoporphyrinogen/coproporphyrinogen III oxidase
VSDLPRRCDVAVVGAGITGLTAAFHLARGGADIVLLEASDRVGGVIEGCTFDTPAGRWRFEVGPNTVLESRPEVGQLLTAAGLDGERVEAAPAAKKRYVWKGGRLVALPGGAGAFFTTPLFSLRAKARLLAEPFIRPAPEEAEETVAEFVRRRLGRELLDYAVGPFVSGVYAGDPERLSVRWAVSRIHALEAEHGGLVRGMLARMRQRRKQAGQMTGGAGPAGPGGAMITFPDGLETLPRRLAEAVAAGPGRVLTATPCRRLLRDGDELLLETSAGPLRAGTVVLATPSRPTAGILDEASAGDSRGLERVPYAAVMVAMLGVRRGQVAHPLDGFGFLAPRRESLRILGCLFTSSFFPGRAPDGHAALTAFAGGRTDPALLELPDDRLLELFGADLARAVGLSGEPELAELRRWPRAIPQYEVGHGRFAALAADLERRLPGLVLAGNYLHGVSVPDRIQRGARVAADLLDRHATAA